MANLDDLKVALKVLRHDRNIIDERIDDLEKEIAIESCPFSIGSSISYYMYAGQQKKGKIIEIRSDSYSSIPYKLIVAPVKKNGELSTRYEEVNRWEPIELID